MDKNTLKKSTEHLNGVAIDSYEYLHNGKVIWGATARILHILLDIL
jgi:hypothetical protein